jgi:predicted DNA-binding transcriptional regulator AlpA
VAKPLSPTVFREESERRLIDTFELMLALGLRSKQAVRKRVKAGTLPPPVYTSANIVALWDRDELELSDTKESQ